MEEKIKAILHADTDIDIKVEMLKELFEQSDDEEKMILCNEFLTFTANRNDLIINQYGILGFAEDCKETSTKQIWGYFKDYLKIKNEINK